MPALTAKALCALFLALTPLPALADDDALRAALKLGASTTLGADISAHEIALRQVMDGFGHVSLHGNGLFLATKAGENTARAWTAFHMNEYNGGTRGVSRRLLAGFDLPVLRRSRLGLVGSFGTADLDTGAQIESRTFSFGPYFRTRLGKNLRLKTWASLSRPVYRFARGRVRATRIGAGARARLERDFGNLKLGGAATMQFSRQLTAGRSRLKAFEISKLDSSLSTRATFFPESNLRPYLDVGLTQGAWTNDSAQGDYSSQTLAAGLTWQKRKQSVSLQLDGRRVFDPAQPLRLTTNYRLSF